MLPFIVIYDTEYTTWPGAMESGWSGLGQHRELVQLAARKWYLGMPWDAGETFNRLCKPVVNPELSSYFSALTGIEQADIEQGGVSAEQLLQAFSVFGGLGPEGAGQGWSNGHDRDILVETARLQHFKLPLQVKRLQSFNDALYAALEQEVGSFERRDYPSGRVHELLGLKLDSSQVHNAMHDVNSLCITLSALMQRGHKNLDFLWDK